MENNEVALLKELFESYTGKKVALIVPITGSGSNRKYYRLSEGNTSLVGVAGHSIDENKAFVKLASHFKSKGLPVPQLLAVSTDYSCYLQEDLGDVSLFSLIQQQPESIHFLLKKTISKLAEFQFVGAQGLDFSICYPQSEFDRRTIAWDLNYFKYCFLKISGIEFEENKLEDNFEELATLLLTKSTQTFLYRDFQSRNVLIKDGEPYFIDFQGGRKGTVYYDVVSFLWQARAQFPDTLKNELLEEYWVTLSSFIPIDRQEFYSRLPYFVLFRTLQVLGAYGFRGYQEKKALFIESIPLAIANLSRLIHENDFSTIPYLKAVLEQLVVQPQFQYRNNQEGLEIRIHSFSYKRGIPEDYSGNGGGYVFDCRSIHNPGRYQEYRSLTGLDQAVIDFLEQQGDALAFMQLVYQLADQHIQCYLERGFNQLMFAFGCTGGQHRSVYCAQQLAQYIRGKYPVKVVVVHREQGFTSSSTRTCPYSIR